MLDFTRQSASLLLIDDEPHILDEVATALLATDYTCRACRDAETAVELARRETPDLIVSDIDLGGMSGLELCERLRSIAPLAETPVIFLSGAQVPDVVRRAHAAGGTYYLRKPFDPQVLLELVDKALWLPHLTANHVRPCPVTY
ncbi:MAG TPA: response regulator [Pirellulales bacterium]|nr:response regulator [Pirellulales bacterium]